MDEGVCTDNSAFDKTHYVSHWILLFTIQWIIEHVVSFLLGISCHLIFALFVWREK
jgi:hypothetical protein